MDVIPTDDVLIRRAASRHCGDLRASFPDLTKSEVNQYSGWTWVHLRDKEKELIGIYKFYPTSGQLRRVDDVGS